MSKADVIIGNHRFTGWKQITVSKSMESLCSSFNLTAIDKWSVGEWELVPGSSIEIRLNNKKVLAGYIDKVDPTISTDSHEIRITGRDKTCDLVDCSAINAPGTWKEVTFETFVKALIQPFGLNFVKDYTIADKKQDFSIQSNEAVAATIQRYANERGLLLLSNCNGDLVVTETARDSSYDGLSYGVNIKQASASYDFTNRFSEYRVKGQEKTQGSGWTRTTINIFGKAVDEAITRHRPLQLSAEGKATNETARKRAEWEASIRAGKSCKVSVNVQGWEQSNGDLWDINHLVVTDIEPLQIENVTLLISSVEYSLSDTGSMTDISLKREDTFKPKPKVNKKKAVPSGGWG